MDSELYLRLRVEALLAGSTDNHHRITESLEELGTTARALRAAGGLDADTAAQVVADTELALLVRGVSWLDDLMTDLPAPRHGSAAPSGALVSVVDAGDTLIEVWSDALVVRTEGGEWWSTPGGVPPEHERVEVRTASKTVSVDVSAGTAARTVEPRTRPMTFVDTLLAWCSITRPDLVARREPPPAARPAPAFEPVAIQAAGGLAITAIEGAVRIHVHTAATPAVAWIVTTEGAHHVALPDFVVESPLPARPAPATLVLVDGGCVTEIDLRG